MHFSFKDIQGRHWTRPQGEVGGPHHLIGPQRTMRTVAFGMGVCFTPGPRQVYFETSADCCVTCQYMHFSGLQSSQPENGEKP